MVGVICEFHYFVCGEGRGASVYGVDGSIWLKSQVKSSESCSVQVLSTFPRTPCSPEAFLGCSVASICLPWMVRGALAQLEVGKETV